ncbi:MAG: rubrerythrin family protein [Anaerolineales bacterium]|nr:rubrerythrin family protein [Anaerolineales bacterium]
MSKTIEDLKAAFAGESQANRKYTYFAEQAEAEGYPQVAKLFRAAAHAEAIHARNHLKALGELKGTAENLQSAIEGENYEVVSMYPEFIRDAEAEANKKALRSFNWALEVEKVHEALYHQALADLGKETGDADYYVCPFCGYTHAGPITEKCPVCGAPPEKFERIS